MTISVITPSFRNSQWLKLCISSVEDQGVGAEHIVQDGGSDDGTLDWLLNDKRVKSFVEPDTGMYDAINRGFKRASGDILAFLNCDEQYLPGALREVLTFFEKNPNVDILFGDFLVVDGDGELLCYRKVQTPLKYHVMIDHLPTFTCATFFRRKILHEHQLFFDPAWRSAGDAEWMLRVLEKKIPMALLRKFVATFSELGTNMGLVADSTRFEGRKLFELAPPSVKMFSRLFILHHRLRRFLNGSYFQGPLDYSIYTLKSGQERCSFHVKVPSFFWKNRF